MNVIVLKSNEPSTTDRYVDFLNAQNSPLVTHVHQINLLKFSFQNLDLLKSKLFTFFLDHTNYEHYVRECFKCLIITSRQTVESMQRAFDLTAHNDHPSVHTHSGLDNNSDKLLVYCVGEATAHRFNQLVQSIKKVNATVDSRLILRCVSDHKQNARELFKLIKQDYELVRPNVRPTSDQFKYALYPCSKIRRDDLSNSLSESGISFEEIHVYDTVPCDTGKQKLANALNKLHGNNVLVFFSPSGSDCVFKDHILNSLIYSRLQDFKFVSVGPTTSSRLRQYIEPALINELTEPSPQALWQTILKISGQNLNS
ncbi:uroporphyrinogen-III synthase isoform X1 [Brachionus plicatilis]|uniref:Uroporphyrinogen-III synthase isoform X1 n=1 Tax=Brachionus plicatilis TaxID=10195 RepID=A0A3M7PP63_BRAPC|nr:uroporphyrinogen-III synthase isoform X1 [Brachionus plicatilis]